MKKFSKSKALAFALAFAMTATMVPVSMAKADGTVKPQIVGNTNSVTLATGDKVAVMKAPVGLDAGTVSYTSSNPKVVAIKTTNGTTYATAVGNGSAIITAKGTKAGVASGTLAVSVKKGQKTQTVKLTPNDTTLYAGQKVKTKIETTPAEASKMMTYKSSNPKVATVSSNGLIKGIAGGEATITATAKDGSGESSSSNITVTAITWNGTKNKVMTVGDTEEAASYFTMIPASVVGTASYVSSDESVIKVEGNKLVAVGAGDVKIQVRANDHSGLVKTYNFTVNEKQVTKVETIEASDLEIKLGDKADINATATPEEANAKLSYEVISGSDIVNLSGKTVTAKSVGTAKVRVTAETEVNSINKTITVSVVPNIAKITEVKADDINMTVNTTQTIKASTVPADLKNVTWSYEVIEGNNIVSVDNKGTVSAKGIGTAKVQVTAANVMGSKSTTITVDVASKNVQLTGITGLNDSYNVTYKKGESTKVEMIAQPDPANIVASNVSYSYILEDQQNNSNDIIAVATAKVGNTYKITVTPKKAGTANLTVVAEDKVNGNIVQKTVVINVQDVSAQIPKLDSIEVKDDKGVATNSVEYTVASNGKLTDKLSITPKDTNGETVLNAKVEYILSSNNDNAIGLRKTDGYVYANRPGTATVTVSYTKDDVTVTKDIIVTVVNSQEIKDTFEIKDFTVAGSDYTLENNGFEFNPDGTSISANKSANVTLALESITLKKNGTEDVNGNTEDYVVTCQSSDQTIFSIVGSSIRGVSKEDTTCTLTITVKSKDGTMTASKDYMVYYNADQIQSEGNVEIVE